MAFDRKEVDELLTACHRRCCICHKFCGIKIETHHIEDDRGDDICNAIPVCFECHAEMRLYNPKHAIGRAYTPAELRAHRKQWLAICRSFPGRIVDTDRAPNPGSLERLVHELEFGQRVAGLLDTRLLGCQFETAQFTRAISDGTFSWLAEDVGNALQEAYLRMKRANAALAWMTRIEPSPRLATARNEAQRAVREAGESIKAALELIHGHLEGA